MTRAYVAATAARFVESHVRCSDSATTPTTTLTATRTRKYVAVGYDVPKRRATPYDIPTNITNTNGTPKNATITDFGSFCRCLINAV